MPDEAFNRLAAPAELAVVSAAGLTRRRCLCQEEEGAPPCACGMPVTREQVGRLRACQAQQPGRAVICSQLAGEWMAALTMFLPIGENPVEAWMREPFDLPPEADLRHAVDLGDLLDLLDLLGAPSAAALS
jgi:hypothetical protein